MIELYILGTLLIVVAVAIQMADTSDCGVVNVLSFAVPFLGEVSRMPVCSPQQSQPHDFSFSSTEKEERELECADAKEGLVYHPKCNYTNYGPCGVSGQYSCDGAEGDFACSNCQPVQSIAILRMGIILLLLGGLFHFRGQTRLQGSLATVAFIVGLLGLGTVGYSASDKIKQGVEDHDDALTLVEDFFKAKAGVLAVSILCLLFSYTEFAQKEFKTDVSVGIGDTEPDAAATG